MLHLCQNPVLLRSFIRQKSDMRVCDTIASFQKVRATLNGSLGFVPTMGGLHEGHVHLVQAAKAECEHVAVSIFVNPLQFGANEDFSKYPRVLSRDISLLKDENVDVIFTPSAEDMYPTHARCVVVPQGFDDLPEGRCRPGHFQGVATVVTKLFNITRPTCAYFGEKDAAQSILVQRMVEDLNFDIAIRVVPTIREENGLARSTRNGYLSKEERQAASVLYRGLLRAKQLFASTEMPNLPSNALIEVIQNEYLSEPLVKKIQYISIASKDNLEPLEDVQKEKGAIVSVAVFVGDCRLIDAIAL